ncbi:MAG TPA: hypothetical protein VJM77_02725 [Nitrospiria bacterium]|nr:hypothetical protein [Nitrospiria bacterium]
MTSAIRKVRKAFFVEPHMIKRAKRLLGLRTDAEVIRESIERVVEMEEFWRFMDKTKGSLKPESFSRD